MVSYHPLGCLLFKVFLLFIFFPKNYAQLDNTAEPEVTISQGTVLGTTMTTRHGRNISAFLGIPYGQPPIGNLRFASPVAANAWNGILNATVDPSKCPQIVSGVVVGEEDCLFLKVYTPQLPQNETLSLLPVMVYIHGGGFVGESPDHNGPGYLLDADVVLVVLNYRLGPLGFLSTGDEVASGNWGLKDQILALKWVQDNIQYFGGDPNQVTIFGESAGAVSVYYLASTDKTIGLFHRCITQSGSSLAAWGYGPGAAQSSRAFELGEFVGCSNDTSDLLISCLRTIDFLAITATQLEYIVWQSLSLGVWGPTDEPDVEGAILTDIPSNLLAAGAVRDLPWITGITRDEGLRHTAALYASEELLTDFLENIDFLLPTMLRWTYESDFWASRLSAAKSYYFNDDLTSNNSMLLKNLTLLINDSKYWYPVYNALEQQFAQAVNPLYFYTFNYRGTYSYTYMDVGAALSYGVRHADDVIYLLPKEEVFSEYNKTMTDTDYEMVDTMVQLWTSFAINGTPTASALVNNGITWEPYSLEDNYLRIGNESDVALEVQYSFFKERMEFWANIDALVNTEGNSESTTEPQVTISQGTVLGTTMTTRHGRNISAFLGIPYGQPPIGNLRFASPVAANAWNGILNATVDPSKCPQIISGIVVGEEDCLFLKVYTPQLPQNETLSLLPVMVYIHGGGFVGESPDHNGPGYLLDADVVLVVLNYRLGPLGFLSTGDKVASGNWGLKDQILALKWVQDNIQYFGGDPNQVTIFGESAGAVSVYYLASTDKTIGLFHRCITQSGSPLAAWGYRPRAAQSSRAFELGEFVGCSNDTSDLLISCLRTIDFLAITATQLEYIVWQSLPLGVWGPTDEPDVEGAILTDIPSNLLAAGAVRDLPWITGITRDEGLLHTAALYASEELLTDFLENIDFLLPTMLRWTYESDFWASRLSAAKSYYFNDDLTSNNSMLLENLTLLINDSKFWYPVYNALEQQFAQAVNPLYFYTFNYRGTYSYTYMDVGAALSYGVRHADDLIYLLPKEEVFSEYNKTMTDTDYEMVDTMVQLWTSFAINGTPTASALVNNGITWEPFSLEDNYLMIGNESDVALEVQYSFFKERMEFWANIDALVNTEENSESTTEPQVTISQGTVLGTTITTRNGRNISAFMGIPFAQPPTGNLRFANPVKADGWNGTLNATADANMCAQIKSNVIVGDEDCLYLNVYTPNLPRNTTNSSLLPVMVYIHGGRFEVERQSSTGRGGPDYLLDADVVLVGISYRLGALGFLSTGDEIASGNWGLKDQVMGLEWVQNNVRYFGGDPDQVTIFGESAGAGSIHLLTLSDATIGLFHRYITQSGSALSAWAHRPRAAYSRRAFELGKYVGCSSNTSDSLISCLRKVDISDIIFSKSEFIVWRSLPDMVWGPTDEPNVEGAILTDSPANLFAAGKTRDLPWILGVVRDEGLLHSTAFYHDEEMLVEFMENFDTLLPILLCWTYQSDSGSAWTNAVKSYYFNNDLTLNTSVLLKNLTMLIGDAQFYYPARNALQQHHALAKNPQYFYTFNYRGTYSTTYITGSGTTENYGITHADDLIYLFPREERFSTLNETMDEVDYQMVDTIVQLWTSFAINGIPTASALGSGIIWPPYSTEDAYLRIGNESDTSLEVQYSFFKERMQFWDSIDDFEETNENSAATVTLASNFLFLLLVAFLKFVR